eukprot:TRINITY_DN25072_c0_g1_i1.p1 TRINITY_DN25072_c0_g1~~TRINITY_DN25072_c0_g1_i1.p1  ORF type:complete len:179 (+),score=26.83 TRINITY_DN25072_c0_g1_i1:56-592(+)
MAATHFLSLTLHSTLLPQPEILSSPPNCRAKHFSFPRRNQKVSVSRALNSSNSSVVVPQKPEIQLEFLAPKPEPDGSYPVQKVSAISGEKLLRNIMIDNKLELYATYGKVMNCGGGGSCGTCIVEITDGKDLLNERTDTELRYLKKKPDSWRLACQTIVGNEDNAGKVVVQRLPQWKK